MLTSASSLRRRLFACASSLSSAFSFGRHIHLDSLTDGQGSSPEVKASHLRQHVQDLLMAGGFELRK